MGLSVVYLDDAYTQLADYKRDELQLTIRSHIEGLFIGYAENGSVIYQLSY